MGRDVAGLFLTLVTLDLLLLVLAAAHKRQHPLPRAAAEAFVGL